MQLPARSSRLDPRLSKKDFGHLLIIAGSPSMLGAAALSALAAMRSGAGLVTAAVPRGCNLALQEKISNVVMTMPLADEKAGGGFSFKAYPQIVGVWEKFGALAIGPGLGRSPSVQRLARSVIAHCPKPLVVDADALFALRPEGQSQKFTSSLDILLKAKGARVLTPHAGEMSRLAGLSIEVIEADRLGIARGFAKRHHCVVLLKGHRTVVASTDGKTYVNRTGNVGMATAGSGDVLTGIIAAFLGQGSDAFTAACWGAYVHGLAGDRAARLKFKRGMIASDIIENLPYALKHA